MSRVWNVGFSIAESASTGYFKVDSWVITSPRGGVERIVYDPLTAAEVEDVVDSYLAGALPRMQRTPEGVQLTLSID